MKVVIIVQARMTSTRLPGKILKTVLGKPLLQYQMERLRRVRAADDFVIATTTNATDDVLVDLCGREGVPVFRGSELDVLARFAGAAETARADVVVRINSDCPIFDPAVSDRVIRHYLDHSDRLDYVSTSLKESFPFGYHTEVVSGEVLAIAHREARDPYEREHVTPFVYRHPERFRLENYGQDTDQTRYKVAVDTPEDFARITAILEGLYPGNPVFGQDELIPFMDRAGLA